MKPNCQLFRKGKAGFILMVESKNYKIHFVALASLFILGNTVIVAPQNGANEYNFFAFLLSVILAVCICFLGFLLKITIL